MDQIAAPVELKKLGSNPVFATYIDEYSVPGHAALNAGLLEAIAAWRIEDEGLQSSNRLGWHSPRTLFSRDEVPFVRLQNLIKTALRQSIKRYLGDADHAQFDAICKAWVNVNSKGAFNTPHDHGGAHLSGSYYVAVPESSDEHSGALEFLSPVGGGALRLPSGSSMTQSKMAVRPREGWMVIFPSHLRHWVYPNQEDADRVSIAFNLKLLAAKRR